MSQVYSGTEKFVKKFTIDLGLLPGYDTSKPPHSLEEVSEAYVDWQKERAEANLPYFSGIVMPSNFAYAYKESGNVVGISEPAGRIEGEVNKEYHEEIFNDHLKVLEIVFNLAQYVGSRAEQERVHAEYEGKFFVLEVKK